MSVFLCKICDNLKDCDFVGCEEVMGELVCGDCYNDLCELNEKQNQEWWQNLDRDERYQEEMK